MKTLAKLARFLVVVAWLAYVGLACLPISWLRNRKNSVWGMCLFTQAWGIGLLKIFNIKVEVHGDLTKTQGSMIAANHLGLVDIFAHAAVFGFRFAPKSDIRQWPLLGRYVNLIHPVWVDRHSKASSQKTLDEFRWTLSEGIPLIVYPEGTSTDGKHGVLPFKSTPFEAVIADNKPVCLVLTRYKVPKGSKVNPCWYGDMTLLPHVWDLLAAPGIIAEIHILPPIHPEGRDRKELAKIAHDLLQAEYDKVYGVVSH